MLSGVRPTWLSRVNPSVKLLTLLLWFVLFLFTTSWLHMLLIAALALLYLLCFSGLTLRHYFWLMPLLLFFFCTTAIPMILYGKGEQVLWQWAWIKVSQESVNQGLLLALRTDSLLLLSCAFVATTKPVHLFYSLMQQWHLPPKYAYAFLAAMNLLPQLRMELTQRRLVEKMMQRKRGLWQRLSFYSLPLLSQAIRKAFQVAIAMEVKGFSQQKKRTYYYQLTYTRYDGIFALSLLLVMVGYALLLQLI
jgi:energy-coupling factor transport system permease protein